MVVVGTQPAPPTRAARAALTDLADHVEFLCPYLRDPRMITWTDSLVLALDGGVPWVFGPAERDPHLGRRGRTVLPRAARSRLAKIATYRVTFRAVTIAHELDAEGPVGDLLHQLASGPQPCSDETARQLTGAVPAHPTVFRAVRLLDQAVHGATSSAQAPARLIGRTLDPIVFGVVAPEPLQPGDASLWYPLTAWRW
jgi:hypothetical protein